MQKRESDLRMIPQDELHSVILRDVSDAVIATDWAMRILSWNDAATRLYGWTAVEAMGQVMDELLQTWFITGTQQEARRALLEDRFWSGEIEQITRDGHRITVDARVSLLIGANGDSIGGVTVNRDATDRRNAIEALRNERDRNRTITDLSPAGIVRLSSDGQVQYVNDRARAILGIQTGQSIPVFDDPQWDITDFEGQPFPSEELPFNVVRQTGEPVYGVCHTIRRRDGSRRFLTIHGVPLKDHHGTPVEMLGVVDDVTDEYQLRSLLKVQRDMLVQIGYADTAPNAAEVALHATAKLSGIECGAVYLRSDSGRGNSLELVTSFGVHPNAVALLSPICLDAPLFRHMVKHPVPYYDRFDAILEQSGVGERMTPSLSKMRGAAIVPVVSGGEMVGTVQVASCSQDEVPALTRDFLEQLSSWLGDIIAKKFYQQELKNAEHAFRRQAEALTEANTALKVILRTQREEQNTCVTALRSQFDRQIRPILTKLQRIIAEGSDGGLVEVLSMELEALLGAPSEPTASTTLFSHLTPREAQVASLIRLDYSSKEIADKLSISVDAVAFHRKQIRSKLGITRTGQNLRQFLIT